MTKIFSLKNFSLLLTSTICLLEEKLSSDWFKECLENKSGMERCIKYDFMASMAFLNKRDDTAAFSPLCSDYIMLLKCTKISFGSDKDRKIKNDLKYLKNQLEFIVSDKFNIFSFSFKKNESLKGRYAMDVYICEIFTGSDPYYIFKKTVYDIFNKNDARKLHRNHFTWAKGVSNELITSPLRIRYPRDFEYIYDSFVFFNDIWAKKFEIVSSDKDFHLSNGQKIPKNLFIRKIILNMQRLLHKT